MSKPEIPRSLGRYQIVRELGKGAMGVVYEGLDPVINRRVAIKTARRDVLESSGMADELLERFLREARAAGGINHPNVITIYDAGEESGIAYMAMEYIDSGTLYDRLCAGSRMSVEEAVEIGAAVCNALAAAHEKGVVHRDVKPANIMMLADNTVKVADFGIARVSDSKLTQEGVMVGTPQYMSPEQFSGMKADGRSDLFSAAVIVYEMLTGEHPFPAHGVSAIMHQVIKVDPVPPRDLTFTINDNLSAVVMKALNKPPNKRYQDGKQMAAALVEALKENADPAVLGLAAPAAGDAEASTVITGADTATVVSRVRPDGTAPDSMASGPGAKPSLIRRSVSRKAFVIPAIAGLAVVAGVLLLIPGSKDSKPPAAASVPPPPGRFVHAVFYVWLAKSATDFDIAEKTKDYSLEHVVSLGKARIALFDDKGNQVSIREEADSLSFDPVPPCTKFTIKASSPGYEPREIEYTAKEPNESLVADVLLRPVK